MSTFPTVVTGANGLVGSRVCAGLVDRGAMVRAVVRRAGAAPRLPGVEEHVGDFGDPAFARAAAGAGVERLVHVSTAAVYDRSPDVGDVDESAALVEDDANDYAVTKRDTDLALATVDGPTRVLVRPPAILGSGETSVWNTLRPAAIREDEGARRVPANQTFAWVHADDLAAFLADLATGRIPSAADPEGGPVAGGCTAVNLAAGPATARDYYGTVAAALGVEATWDHAPAWTGRIVADRARGWGWTPTVDLSAALAEIAEGLDAHHS